MEVQKWYDISGPKMDKCKRVAVELFENDARLEAVEHNGGWSAPGGVGRQSGKKELATAKTTRDQSSSRDTIFSF
jgi:hypothetical protein